ncbi:MAG: hypothetical protein O2890_13575, partial [Cyanobacteria bacterium]|nr:hypothetical protein [Cyanobacteriota bacterium]
GTHRRWEMLLAYVLMQLATAIAGGHREQGIYAPRAKAVAQSLGRVIGQLVTQPLWNKHGRARTPKPARAETVAVQTLGRSLMTAPK